MKRLPLALLAAAALAVAVPAAAQDVAAGSPTVTVSIENFTFSPETVTVAPGTTVTWVNRDDIPHLVVDTGKGFRSKALDTGDSYSFTFASPGSFEYFCALHPHMTGKVVVAPGAG
ncbi:MAG: cupredoxin family copper-binding protein [Amaricoccus sp.]